MARAASGVEPQAGLSADRVLQAAIVLADRAGLDGLSMRRLAGALGVQAMSIYYYFPNRDAILDGIVDLVVGEFELPSPGGTWKDGLRAMAISAHSVLEQHPWACGLMMAPRRVGGARKRYMNAMLGQLREAGFSAGQADVAYHALDSHIIGSTLWEVGYAVGSEDLSGFAEVFLRSLDGADLPYLAEHVREHMRPPDAHGNDPFLFGLDLILEGLDRLPRGG